MKSNIGRRIRARRTSIYLYGRIEMMKRPRILLADDHVGVTRTLQDILNTEFDVVGVTQDGFDLVERATALNPDVVVADLSMPRLDGLGAMALLKERAPGVKFILLTMYQD